MVNKTENRKAIEVLERVRIAMILIGAQVVERQLPEISVSEGRSCYSPSLNQVFLAKPSDLVHELAHSQQAEIGTIPVSYRLPDGTIDPSRWMSEPREIEARSVEAIEPHLDSEWLTRLVSVLDRAGKSRSELAGWVKFIEGGDVTARKPFAACRSERMAINKILREVAE